MNILVTGSSGFIGKQIVKFLKSIDGLNVKGMSKSEGKYTDYCVNLLDKTEVNQILSIYLPDVVIHAAAFPNVEECEKNREKAYDNNVKLTENLINIIKNLIPNTYFLFFSSDYVYSGDANSNYNEQSQTNPVNYYGECKLQCEKIIAASLNNYCILRITVVFGYEPCSKNFLMQILRNNNIRKIPIDQINNPTSIYLINDIVLKCIKKRIVGTFNSTGKESFNRYDFLKSIVKEFGLNLDLYSPVLTKELNQTAPRPLNCRTDSSKIKSILAIEEENLVDYIKIIKNDIYGQN